MNFRRHSREEKRQAQEFRKELSAWMEEHAALVEATGLPASCFEPETWEFFLEHGFLLEGEISVGRLLVRQKAALLRLIMTRPIDLRTYVGHVLVLALLDAVDQSYRD